MNQWTFARRPDWALYYALYAAGALIVTGIFHLVTGAVFLAVALIQLAQDRRRSSSLQSTTP